MPSPKYTTCAGCSQPLQGKAKAIWCPECLSTVEQFTVELTAEQRQRVETLAVVRGVSCEEVLRQGVEALTGKTRGKLPTDVEIQRWTVT